ncbi:hypothetical protein DL767_008395 [Monosporascus sp. MG133]|nr:hypothetical protein DL767_008395 [Monosporascus sp. MG133]
MASMRKRAAATRSSESAFRFKSKAKGRRSMNDANYSYDNPFSNSDDILSNSGGFPSPDLAGVAAPAASASKAASRGDIPAYPSSAQSSSAPGRVTEGPAPFEDRDALKRRDEETINPVRRIKRGRDDEVVNLYDVPERPAPSKNPRHDDVSDPKGAPPIPRPGSQRRGRPEAAGRGRKRRSLGQPGLSWSRPRYQQLRRAGRSRTSRHSEEPLCSTLTMGHYAPWPQYAIWQHIQNLIEAVQQYGDRCAEGYDDPEYLEMLFKYLDSIKSWQEKTSGATAVH